MEKISKSELKAEMLAHFMDLESDADYQIVTDHGKPTLTIKPIDSKAPRVDALFANDRGKVKYHADILESTMDEWSEI